MKSDMMNRLEAPFPAEEVHFRPGSTNSDKTKAMPLAYIDARNVMDRLDLVVGPEGWQRKHRIEDKFVIASIGILVKLHDNTVGWVWKEDGADITDIEAIKGGLSDAFKRAAVSWGIGRYLYGVDLSWQPISNKRFSNETLEVIKKEFARKTGAPTGGVPTVASQIDVSIVVDAIQKQTTMAGITKAYNASLRYEWRPVDEAKITAAVRNAQDKVKATKQGE